MTSGGLASEEQVKLASVVSSNELMAPVRVNFGGSEDRDSISKNINITNSWALKESSANGRVNSWRQRL